MSWRELQTELEIDLEPIRDFPGRQRNPAERERGTFSAPFRETLKLLKLELGVLWARETVVQIDVRESDFGEDGLPRPETVSLSPAIVLAFHSRYGYLKIGFDRYKRWEHNLRAIALYLEHLREASAFGVGSNGEAYRGWIATAPPFRPRPKRASSYSSSSGSQRHQTSRAALFEEEKAAAFLSLHGGKTSVEILTDEDAFQTAYRAASVVLHPDRGGDHEAFVRLQWAVDTLKNRYESR